MWTTIKHNYNSSIKYFLFLVNPIISLIFSIRSIKEKSSYVVIFLFFIIFGFSFNALNNINFDSYFYATSFKFYQNYSYSNYSDDLNNYLRFDDSSKDFFYQTICFIISRFTDNYHYLFATFAALFGFFYLKSLSFLTKEPQFDYSYRSYLLLFLFTISNTIFNINGIRFWLSAWIGIFCIFQIIQNKKYTYLLLVAFIPFIHASFFSLWAIIVLAIFTKKYYNFWIILFLVSFIISNLSVELFRAFSTNLPMFLQRSIEGYTDLDYINFRNSKGTGFNWVSIFFSFLTKTFVFLSVIVFIKERKTIISNSKSAELFKFLLIWMTFVNFTMPIPSVGVRFINMSHPIIAYIWLIICKNLKYNYLIYTIPIIYSFSTFWLFYSDLSSVIDLDFYVINIFYLIYNLF